MGEVCLNLPELGLIVVVSVVISHALEKLTGGSDG